MPDLQPIHLNETNLEDLQHTLNYMFERIYSVLDEIQGRRNKTFAPGSINIPSGTSIDTVMSHDHKSASAGGDYDWADLEKVATGADAVAVSAIALNAGADSVDRAAFNIALTTLVTEINALKTVINNIWDQIQATNLMT